MAIKKEDELLIFLKKYIDNCLIFMDGEKENSLWTGLVVTLGDDSIPLLSCISGKTEKYIADHVYIKEN